MFGACVGFNVKKVFLGPKSLRLRFAATRRAVTFPAPLIDTGRNSPSFRGVARTAFAPDVSSYFFVTSLRAIENHSFGPNVERARAPRYVRLVNAQLLGQKSGSRMCGKCVCLQVRARIMG